MATAQQLLDALLADGNSEGVVDLARDMARRLDQVAGMRTTSHLGSPTLVERPTYIQKLALELVDKIESAFLHCEHPHTDSDSDWCNICGATRLQKNGTWVGPHWRDILVPTVLIRFSPNRER